MAAINGNDTCFCFAYFGSRSVNQEVREAWLHHLSNSRERCRAIDIHEINRFIAFISKHDQKVALPFAQVAKNTSRDGFVDGGEDIEVDVEMREGFIGMFNKLAADAHFFEKIRIMMKLYFRRITIIIRRFGIVAEFRKEEGKSIRRRKIK